MASLSPERKKLLERIAKLLALADNEGAFDAEAEAAREAAYRLMAEHNLKAAKEQPEPFETRTYNSWFGGDVWWDRRLRTAIGDLNNCYLMWWNSEKTGASKTVYLMGGRPRDLDAYEYMYGIVVNQRGKAWNDYKAGGGAETKAKWLYGYMRGVEDKVAKILEELNSRMQMDGHNMLAPISLLQQVHDWMKKKFRPKTVDEHPMGGARDGFAAGSNVNLYRGEIGAPSRQLGHVRRLTHD